VAGGKKYLKQNKGSEIIRYDIDVLLSYFNEFITVLVASCQLPVASCQLPGSTTANRLS